MSIDCTKRRKLDAEQEDGLDPDREVILPKELIVGLLNSRAELRLIELLEKFFSALFPPDPKNEKAKSLVARLCRFLRNHKVVIAGSMAVKAFLGSSSSSSSSSSTDCPATEGWMPNDLDLFCDNETFKKIVKVDLLFFYLWPMLPRYKNYRRLFDLHDASGLLNGEKEEEGGCHSHPSYGNFSVYNIKLPIHGKIRQYLKIQLITHKTSINRAFYPKNTIDTIRKMLEATFDLLICTSYYDGHAFHAWNPLIAIHRVSYLQVIPPAQSRDQDHWPVSGQTWLLKRPFTVYNAEFFKSVRSYEECNFKTNYSAHMIYSEMSIRDARDGTLINVSPMNSTSHSLNQDTIKRTGGVVTFSKFEERECYAPNHVLFAKRIWHEQNGIYECEDVGTDVSRWVKYMERENLALFMATPFARPDNWKGQWMTTPIILTRKECFRGSNAIKSYFEMQKYTESKEGEDDEELLTEKQEEEQQIEVDYSGFPWSKIPDEPLALDDITKYRQLSHYGFTPLSSVATQT